MKDALVPDVPVESLLVNVFSVAKNGVGFQRLMNAAGQIDLVLDSGGYQLHQAEEKAIKQGLPFDPIFNEQEPLIQSPANFNLTPKHVVDIAANINPDIVMGLDFPILKIKDVAKQDREFYKKLQHNRDWTIRTSDLMIQKGLDTNKLFIPIQCYNINQFNIFYRCIRGQCQFGGLSMPVRNLTLEKILEFLLKIYELGIRRVHLLGTTAARVIALSAFMARHFFNWFSLDSTTWLMMANNGQYLAMDDLKGLRVGREDHISRTKALTCTCPWCHPYVTFGGIIDMEAEPKADLLYRHNFTVTQYFARNAYATSGSANSLKQFVTDNFENSTIARKTITAIHRADMYLTARRQRLQPLAQSNAA